MSAWLAQERAHPIKEGVTAGRYTIGAVTDADAISVTYLAHDQEQNRQVCLREFLPCLISRRDPDGAVRAAHQDCSEAFDWAKDCFLREGQAQLRVHHPSLAPITALQTISGSTFLASVPLEGQSLEALLGRHGRLRAQELHELATPLLGALKVLHGTDTLHTGISARAVWITPEGVPVLSPVARAAIDLAQGLELDDLLADLAPEQLAPQQLAPQQLAPDTGSPVGRHTDIFGLGSTLYEAATGQPAASVASRLAALSKRSMDPYEPIEILADPAMPAVMAAAINAALALDPQARPQSVEGWKANFQGQRISEDDLLAEAETATGADADDGAESANRPAKLKAPIEPPMPLIQPELPLPADVPMREGAGPAAAGPPADRIAPQLTGADTRRIGPDGRPIADVAACQEKVEPVLVAPRRAAAAIASARTVAGKAKEAAPRNITRLGKVQAKLSGRLVAGSAQTARVAGKFVGRSARTAKNAGGLAASLATAAGGGIRRTRSWAGRLTGAAGGLTFRDRRWQIGGAVTAVLALLVAGSVWLSQTSAPPDGPNVSSMKVAEQRSKKTRTAAGPQGERAKGADRKATEATERAAKLKALAAAWSTLEKLRGDERIAAEKQYYEKALALHAREAVAWHSAAVAAHRDGDFKKALAGFEKAAKVGYLPSQVSIGFFYVNGHGVKADAEQAAMWFRRAAERGNRVAQSNLAGQYTTGRGVVRDFKEAHRWALAAAKQGDPTAHGRLGYLYRYGLGVKKDPKMAMTWYRKGAALHHVWSMAEIGALYENGEGVKRDAKRAAHWYRRARRQGSQYAEKRLNALRRQSRN